MFLCISLQVARNDSNTYLGSGLVANDTITWAKGEVLGKGAYGTVSIQIKLQLMDLLKTLRHSNIVGFLGTSLYQHVVSIFMEYIPGGSIASILHRLKLFVTDFKISCKKFGPLPERVLALYTHQILEGVAFLHQNRVIHRDLKGNNVMLMPTGVIKLIDFGCARRLSCLNPTAPNSGELLKSIHGTPYWMAPEVINESGYGRKSDIWSVGCTVFEMATGKPPLAHMDKMAALFYIGARRGLMPSLPDGFSENAKDFVKICLTSDQSVRPSADQLLKHSFIPKGHTSIKYWEAQKKKCCGTKVSGRRRKKRDKNKEEDEEGRRGGKLATELRAGRDTLQYRRRARRRKGGRKRWSTCSTSATLGDFAHFGAGSRR
uniref:Mitogen-activated protein kinase kinase kinase 19 n=1 Tax=Poecilia latipinna TaxID=48699 RepID=A0A3B3UZH3_9TELE